MDATTHNESMPVPKTIGPYRVECLLGSGGMGDVYQAFDPRLDRRVAIKHIRPEFARNEGYRLRLEREAKTIASLDHPAIVQVFDIMQDEEGDGEWIVMEFVDGPSVHQMLAAGPLDIATAVDIGLDVIHGLEAAHSRGVLHRDLKTENVMVTRAGSAKILDFGLAKRLESTNDPTISIEGKVLGTARVMSPEQANGLELDSRSDLFSFGVLLYEMVTGRAPFRGSTPVATILKAFGEPHRDVREYNFEVPDELAELIDSLLEKKRDDRPGSAREVAAALEALAGELTADPAALHARIRAAHRSRDGASQESWLDTSIHPNPNRPRERATASEAGTGAANGEAPATWESSVRGRRLALALALAASMLLAWLWYSGGEPQSETTGGGDARIVVLPFENYGPADRGYFAAGLTSELIRELTSRRGLAVVSYRTSRFYESSGKSSEEIGSELDVSHVLEGDVFWADSTAEDSQLRIGVNLVRASDGHVLLSKSFDRSASDMLRVQSEIADIVSSELGVQILADTRRDLSAEPRALDAFFRGIALWYGSGYSLQNIEDAEGHFETAVDVDPDFVLAWTELARARSVMVFNGLTADDKETGAREALEMAQRLAPNSRSVRLATGYFDYYVLESLAEALDEFRQAAEMRPEDPEAREAIGLVLRRQGRLREAVASLDMAFDLDRANYALAGVIGETVRGLRDYDDAERWFTVALRTSSGLPYVMSERAENFLARRGCGDFTAPPRCPVEEARNLLSGGKVSQVPSLWIGRVDLAVFDLANGGDPEDFLAVYDSVPESEIEASHRFMAFWRKALLLREMGREREASALVERYRMELEYLSEVTEDWVVFAALGMAYGLEGQTDDAARALDRASEQLQGDDFTGPRVTEWRARVAVVTDRASSAVEHLNELVQREYQGSISAYELHADPIWQPLREQGLLDELWARLRERERSQ